MRAFANFSTPSRNVRVSQETVQIQEGPGGARLSRPKNGHAVATLSRADRMVKTSRRWTNKVSERGSGECSSSETEATRTSDASH